ncbi:MAG: hypothetical protein IH587_10975 [Anaerolineae bacterium]|nr:hypothetical protein [Anaerolineae bacterium]
MPEEIELIAPEAARAILEHAIAEQLGDDWQDDDSGWMIVSMHDYMARLTRGRVNVDFYVDLLGEVEIKRGEISPAQDAGRLVALTLLGLSIVIALMIAHIVGWL